MPVGRQKKKTLAETVAQRALREAQEKVEEPSWFQKFLGPLDALPAAWRSMTSNATRSAIQRESERSGPVESDIEGILRFGKAATAATTPLGLIRGNITDRPEDAYNPIEEFGKAWSGRDAANHTATWDELMRSNLVTDKVRATGTTDVGRFLPALAMNLADDPTMWFQGGTSAITKMEKVKRLAKLTEGGVTAAKLADAGVDVAKFVAKYGDEFGGADNLVKMLDEGTDVLTLGSDVMHDVGKQVGRVAGMSQAGKVREVGVPFAYKTDKGVKAGAWAPGLAKLDDAERAAAKARGGGTILERLGRKPTLLATDAVKQGSKYTVKLGKRAADLGGLKFAGSTVLDIQPFIDDIAYNIGKFMRGNVAADEGAGILGKLAARGSATVAPATRLASKTFSVYADIDQLGNEALSAWARASKEAFDSSQNIATQLGSETALGMARRLSNEESHYWLRAKEEVLSPESLDTLTEVVNARKATADEAFKIQKENGLLDEGGAERLLGAAGSRAARANTAIEDIADEQAVILEQMADISERAGGAKTASTLRAEAAALRGEAKGTGRAVGETDRAVRDAVADAERFGEREMRFGGKAIGLEDVAPVAKAEIPSGSLYPPRTLDEYITATHGPGGDEVANEGQQVFDEIRSYMRQHNAAIDDGNEVGAEMAEAFSRIPGLNNLRKSHRFNAKRTAIPADTIREHLGQMFPQFTGMGEGDFLNEIDRLTTAVKSSMGKMDVDDIIEQVGSDNIIDALVGKVDEAIAANDLTAAKAWQAHVDEFARRQQPFSEEGLPGMADSRRLAEKAVAKRRAALRAQESRTKLAQAYKSGRATGYAETARLAGADAVRAEKRLAKAQGRQAEYGTVIDRLQDTAAKKQTAYEAMRSLESQYSSLEKRRASWMSQMERGLKSSDDADRILAELVNKQAKVAALDEQIAYIVSKADYARARTWLVKQDIEPERADDMIALMQETDEGMLTNLRELMAAAGLKQKEKLPGAGSMGYAPHIDVSQRSPITEAGDDIAAALGKPGANPLKSANEKARDAYLGQQYGTDLAHLETPEPARMKMFRRGVVPEQPKASFYKTEAERVGKAGLAMETDARVAMGMKVRKDMSEVGKAQFQDSVVSSVGERIGPMQLPAEGYDVMEVTRNGKKMRYQVPAVVKEWTEGYSRVILNDESLSLIARGVDRITNLLKRQMTIVNPRFHIRNMQSNYVLAAFKGLADPGSWEDGYRAMAAVRAGKGAEFFVELPGVGRISADDLYEALRGDVIRGNTGFADLSRSAAQRARQEIPRQGLISEITRMANPVKAGGEAGEFIEDGARVGVYLSALRTGVDDVSARALVDRTLYNYLPQNFTAAEREVFKRALPFYGWLRQNLPNIIETALTSPGKINWLTKLRNTAFSATDIDPTTMPEWMQDMGYFPIPGVTTEGGNALMFNPSAVPVQDIAALGGGLKEPLSRANPALKTPFELAANHDFYYERAVDTGKPVKAPWYIEGIVKRSNELFSGSESWAAFKRWANIYDLTDEDTGKPFVGMDAKPRKALKDLLPFIEQAGKMLAPTDDTKGELDRFSYVTSISAREFDEAMYDEQKSKRIEEQLQRNLKQAEAEGLIESGTGRKKRKW